MDKNDISYRLLIELLCIILVVTLLFVPLALPARAATSTTIDNGSERTIYVEGYVTEGSMRGGMLTQLPISGAVVYFIRNNQVVNQSKTNAIGYYSVVITSGDYSVVAAASGYETLMMEKSLGSTQSMNIVLEQIPYNGFVPYALYPVVETSPGRPVSATIVVENSQVIDQQLTFSASVPGSDWVAWFPDGDMLVARSGATEKLEIMFQYNGDGKGADVMKVVVNGGTFYAEIPVVVIVKDMPYESLDLYSNAPDRVVKPGTTTNFVFSVNNKYARAKPLLVNISKPEGWGASTLNGTYFYAYQEQLASSDLWVYVPEDAKPGYYFINVTLEGEDTRSNTLQFRVKVEGTPLYEALIKGYKSSGEGYPAVNLTDGDPIDIPVRVYNNGDFPLEIYAYAEVGDNWDTYVSGAPWGRIKVEPGGAGEFTVRSKVPNGTTGNYTAKIYLESDDQDQTLIAMLDVKPKQKVIFGDTSLPALLLTGATVGAIALSLVLATTKKRRRY